LEWDDTLNLVKNTHIHTLDLSSLIWLLTTHYRGPYEPLTWLSWNVDYLLWGMNPAGYHFINVLLHSLNAILFYYVADLLLRFISRSSFVSQQMAGEEETRVRCASLLAALFFAIHPLRVESVAWATERRDVLSGFFFLASFYCYLAAHAGGMAHRRERILSSILLFLLAVLAKATAVGLVWALLAVDLYPFKRWDLKEKIPYLVIAVVAGEINFMGFQTRDLAGGMYRYWERILIFLYGSIFYVWKTLWPANLSPYYQLPTHLITFLKPLAVQGALAVLMSWIFFMNRRRWPGVFVAWACYLLMLAPVSGLVQNGQQITADRYSYLACMPFALVAGQLWWGLKNRWVVLSGSLLVLIGLGVRTTQQIRIWRDDQTLWRHAIAVTPEGTLPRWNLASFLLSRGDYTGAEEQYKALLQMAPQDLETHLNLGFIYETLGKYAAAHEQYENILRMDPGNAQAQNNLAGLLLKEGNWKTGRHELEKIVLQHPELAEAQFNLGIALMHEGRKEVGRAHLRLALQLNPQFINRIPSSLRKFL